MSIVYARLICYHRYEFPRAETFEGHQNGWPDNAGELVRSTDTPPPTPGIRVPGGVSPVILVRRFALQLVAAVVAMTVSAVFDLGPRASAAYLSAAAGASAASDLGMGGPTDETPAKVAATPVPQPTAYLQQGCGGMTPPSSGPTSSPPPVAGHSAATELPVSGLVVYFREPAASFDLTAFIDPILDPPRQA